MVFVASLVGITLLPEFANQCRIAGNNDSLPSMVATIVQTILPLLYGVICIAGMVGPLYKLFR